VQGVGFLFEAVFAVRTWPPQRRFDGNDPFLNGRENEPASLTRQRTLFWTYGFGNVNESESSFPFDSVGQIKVEAFC